MQYVLAAVFARMATGAATVSVILLASEHGAQGKVAGLFAACITFPHLFGPLYGKWLDEACKPFRLIALASLLFVLFFQLAIVSFVGQYIAISIVCLLICGACSSFLMGGLSTQLMTLVSSDSLARRRAQNWDTLTYGLGLTLGPMSVAVFTAWFSTSYTISILMCLPILAALICINLSRHARQKANKNKQQLSFKRAISILYLSKPLLRTLVMTGSASFSVAALPVIAVYLALNWNLSQEAGAYLVTLYGIGCICGALILMLKPLKQDALILLRNVGLLLMLSLFFIAISWSFNMALVGYWLCGVINSIFFAITLAARTEYAPKQGASQIYMWVAAFKITLASIGALVAGVLVDSSVMGSILFSSLVLVVAIVICFQKKN